MKDPHSGCGRCTRTETHSSGCSRGHVTQGRTVVALGKRRDPLGLGRLSGSREDSVATWQQVAP
eukprot:7995374-Lingulodinium_polyedra.AAC.1